MTGHEHTYTAELEARITALMVQRDRMRKAVEAVQELLKELDGYKFSMGTTYGSTKSDEIYCDGWNDAKQKIRDALAAALDGMG